MGGTAEDGAHQISMAPRAAFVLRGQTEFDATQRQRPTASRTGPRAASLASYSLPWTNARAEAALVAFAPLGLD
jgi:hypothetical protein